MHEQLPSYLSIGITSQIFLLQSKIHYKATNPSGKVNGRISVPPGARPMPIEQSRQNPCLSYPGSKALR